MLERCQCRAKFLRLQTLLDSPSIAVCPSARLLFVQRLTVKPVVNRCAPEQWAGGQVTSGGRDSTVQQYHLRRMPPQSETEQPQQTEAAAGGSTQPPQQQVPRQQDADAEPTALPRWKRLAAAGQALTPTNIERLPGISTPVLDMEIPASGGCSRERIIGGWQVCAGLTSVLTFPA